MNNPVTVALIYDFDGTLSPGTMQEYDFIPGVGKQNEQFWEESNALAVAQDADPILVYLSKMIREATAASKSLRREAFVECGRNIALYPGVKEWFARVNEYAKERGVILEHYINSSGLKEIIEGTEIAKEFKHIYACSFLYDVDGIAYWPAVAVNYTNKTQFLFKINKGIESVFESKLINEFVEERKRPIPFKQMIYIGDGMTDIPCMRLVKEKSGHSIAVFNPESQSKRRDMEKLIRDGRVSYVCQADYRQDSELDNLVKAIIDKIVADVNLQKFEINE